MFPERSLLAQLMPSADRFLALLALCRPDLVRQQVNSGAPAPMTTRSRAVMTHENKRRTIQHGQPGSPRPLSLRCRPDCLSSLLPARVLSSRATGREIRTGKQPSRFVRQLYLRLPLARRGPVKEGQVGLRRPPTGPWTAAPAGRAARNGEAAARQEIATVAARKPPIACAWSLRGPQHAVDAGDHLRCG